ncbi:MAG: aminopeptidase P family protein [Chitinophagales bacterium]|nr:aminopeptidase P family protein [Chitinophagales bacterium]
MNVINHRLQLLRARMQEHGIDAYVIPSQDPHQSEYVAEYWKGRAWISGFTGSAGTAIITMDYAGVWTDSRYFLQGENELADSEFILERQTIPHAPQHLDWLANHLPKGATLGFDGDVFSVAQINRLRNKLAHLNIQYAYAKDLLNDIWTDRPALPQTNVFELPTAYAGQSRAEKITAIRAEMGTAAYYLVTGLDDIAWLLNIRGSDIDFNPVSISYLLIGKEEVRWFIDDIKVPESMKTQMVSEGIELMPYDALAPFLRQLSPGMKVLYAQAATSVLIYEAMEKEQWMRRANLIRPLKAIKNEIEIGHIREAMRKDGVALLRLYRWLDKELKAGRTISEYDLGEQLAAFRAQQGNYHGESFSAIVGYKGNGAIVHYRAEQDSCAQINKEGMLLLDSGGQYTEGTTDITRTICLSEPTEEQQRHYTLVLKGNIALSRAVFPKGTTGVQLDTLARMHLWQHGLNYGHGTGHGVGFFLNVHEPPQGFAPSPKAGRGLTPFEPGMLTSNEPGYYKADAYGIRIENLEICVEKMETEHGPYYGFEPVTLFPISTKLIKRDLLNTEEQQWLNDYHQKVLNELLPLLEAEEQAWLKEQCAEI